MGGFGVLERKQTQTHNCAGLKELLCVLGRRLGWQMRQAGDLGAGLIVSWCSMVWVT